jgi:hypothetical protein
VVGAVHVCGGGGLSLILLCVCVCRGGGGGLTQLWRDVVIEEHKNYQQVRGCVRSRACIALCARDCV